MERAGVMSAHLFYLEGEDNNILDYVVLCSDSCHKLYAQDNGLEYQGWNGLHYLDTSTPCAVCATIVEAFE